MPNHITNILKFEGDSEQVHAMLDKIKSDELGLGSIDFNKIIPMPESLNIEAGSRTDEALYVCMMALNPAAPDMGVPKYMPSASAASARVMPVSSISTPKH